METINNLEIEKLEEGIQKLRTRKDELSSRYELVLKSLNEDYVSAISTLDEYIKKLKQMKEQLKNANTDFFYDCLPRHSKAENFLVIPRLNKRIKNPKLKVFRLEEPQGLLRGENIKKCQHLNEYFFESSCGKVHCLKCYKDHNKLGNMQFEEYLTFKETPETDKVEIGHNCPCNKPLSRRDLLIIKWIPS